MNISIERLEEICNWDGCLASIPEANQMAEELLALRQAQQEPFMYAVRCPYGSPWIDSDYVGDASEKEMVERAVKSLNETIHPADPKKYEVVALYTSPVITHSELWCPHSDPITGDQFFLWMEHPDLGYVPTYGGPYDSFTLTERDGNSDFFRHRYDHDAGAWVDDEAVYLPDDSEEQPTPPAPAVPDNQMSGNSEQLKPLLDTAKLFNKFYERYPQETFACDSDRAQAAGYFMSGAEIQCFGEYIDRGETSYDE
ncbi:hypothetical protein [Dickeya zeae]|uniref:hypothetical protein n=1 Tax=Dickeya zeae TaxID=204042 RepID=UPI0003C7DD44|nr:hypothetical protein [Dickeya zeae]